MEKSVGEEIIELISAREFGQVKEKLASLEDGAIDEEGNTLYHEAVRQQNVRILRWLLMNYRSTIPPYKPNKAGTTSFHIACSAGRTPCFQALWAESKVQPRVWCKNTDADGYTALHTACLSDRPDVVKEILSKLKEDVAYASSKRGQTALHMAAAGGFLYCVKLLAPYKDLINTRDTFGATALHYATNGGHLSTVKYLIEKCKADKSLLTKNKLNLVHAAVTSGALIVVKYMLGKTKLSMHVMGTGNGATVIHIATGNGYEDILEHLLSKPYIHPLINDPEMNGWTAAHLAAMRNRPACLAVLIRYDADIYQLKDKNGLTAYQIMCSNEAEDMRKTFPHLFSHLDSLREHRRSEARHKNSRLRNSRKSSTNSKQLGGDKSSHGKRRKSSAGGIPSLSTSDIFQNGFTKTNPLAHTPSTSLHQRRFQKNNMTLPRNDLKDANPIMSYQVGREDDSDDDFHIDDIEQIPETPMRTIQQFNNFRHSTYTPTQSQEDLTKIGVGAGEYPKSQSNAAEVAGEPLPIILDYASHAEGADEALTIYFHNGELNTVKVKTVKLNGSTVTEQSDGPIKHQDDLPIESLHVSRTGAAHIELHQEGVDQAIGHQIRTPSSYRRTPVKFFPTPPRSPPPILSPSPPPPLTPSQSQQQQRYGEYARSHKSSESSTSSMVLPPPLPPPLDDFEIMSSDMQTEPPITTSDDVKERSSLEDDNVETSPGNAGTWATTDVNPTSQIKPVVPLSPLVIQESQFQFKTIETADDNNIDEEHSTKAVPEDEDEPATPDTLEREYLSFAKDDITTLQNGIQKKAAPGSREIKTRFRESEEPEPDYAVIVKRDADKPTTDTNRSLRRLSSNASDASETNSTSLNKSSTTYKLNYRAYKKKISNRHDTVTDLFEYDPVN